VSIALLAIAGAALSGSALLESAAGSAALRFESHAAFFSSETHQAVAIDPQVFVRTPGAAAGVGPQNIAHALGLAPARLSSPPETALFAANGKPLNITLGLWLGANGTAQVEAVGDRDRVTASFTGLIPGGLYSLFAVTFQPSGNTFAPLDGTGGATNFVALNKGTAQKTVLTPARLAHANAILLVYHSDGKTHGASRGAPGVTAHHQLITRVP
jgi:hypothetical protein